MRRSIESMDTELYSLKRQLRQRTILFSIMLSYMGGCTFEFDLIKDTTYITRLDKKGELSETILPGFRKWFRMNVTKSDEFLMLLNEYINSNGASNGYENFGIIESPANLFDEGFRWYRAIYQILRDETGRLSSIVGYVHDIEDEMAQKERLESKALRDSMTKLYNRATTERLINEQLKELTGGEKGVLFLIDVDNFKHINDNFGHLAGDEYLIAVSTILKEAFSDTDVVGRLGGDEMAVFIKGRMSHTDIESQGNRLVELFAGIPFRDDYSVTCSIGIAFTEDCSMNYEKLLAQADESMYKSKSNGKNQFFIYGE